MATQTPFTAPLPDPQTQVPDDLSTMPPSQGMTLSTHLPGVPVCVRGSHGASGAQLGPLRPGAHWQFGGVPTRFSPHVAVTGFPPAVDLQFGGVPVKPDAHAVVVVTVPVWLVVLVV